MIYERDYELSKDERNTLLFLTGGNKLLKRDELSKEEIWNLDQFFGCKKEIEGSILKVIVFKDKVTVKYSRKDY